MALFTEQAAESLLLLFALRPGPKRNSSWLSKQPLLKADLGFFGDHLNISHLHSLRNVFTLILYSYSPLQLLAPLLKVFKSVRGKNLPLGEVENNSTFNLKWERNVLTFIGQGTGILWVLFISEDAFITIN